MKWTQAQFDAYQARHKLSSPVVKQVVLNEPLATNKGKEKHAGRITVIVTSFRRRLLDQDNLCPKYFIDGLRYSGLIPDDKPDIIDLQIRQEKVSQKSLERTEIEIIEP
jgi:hypothetical protein